MGCMPSSSRIREKMKRSRGCFQKSGQREEKNRLRRRSEEETVFVRMTVCELHLFRFVLDHDELLF